MLTDREKWLMRQAWIEGWDTGAVKDFHTGMDDWLSDMAVDAVTVEMVLEKDAPVTDHEEAIKQAVAAERIQQAEEIARLKQTITNLNALLAETQDDWEKENHRLRGALSAICDGTSSQYFIYQYIAREALCQ